MAKINDNDNAKIIVDMTGFILNLLFNFVFYVFVVYILLELGGKTMEFTYQVFGNETMTTGEGTSVEVTINEGSTAMEVASVLEDYKVIKSRYSFYVKIRVMGYTIQKGTYVVGSSMTYDEILKRITNYSYSIKPVDTKSD